MSRRPAPGQPYCCYCKRDLTPAHPIRSMSFTLDHVKAQSEGGRRRVPCCHKCNLLKDNLPMVDWFWFISKHSRWWKLFDSPAQVLDVVRREYSRRAYANAAMKASAA